ncbi:VCBS repeat-containing protein [Saprospiraceae bacterium]|nr:VCBS repeat-containing protein [Saprospiraceae bacterium]
MAINYLNKITLIIPFVHNFISLLILVPAVLMISSCDDDSDDFDVGTSCRICGVADRLPADIVSMEKIYLSAEFLDVDGDGDLDMAMGSWDSPADPESRWALTDRLLLNDGSGYFTDAPEGSMPLKIFNGVFSGATGITSIDANNDGHMDMIFSSWASDLGEKKLQLLINDGNGKFMDSTDLISENVESHIGWVGVADFDDDGKMDFWNPMGRWINTGTGFTRDNTDAVAVADIDGDNLPDMIRLAAINEEFETQGLPTLEGGHHGTVAFDADSDGDNDLFVAQDKEGFGMLSAPVKILLNNGTGVFSYANDTIFIPSTPSFFFTGHNIMAADYNGDGLTDVFIQEGGTDLEPYPGGQNRILIQKANGTFADETDSRLPIYNDYGHGVAIGDIDNDGDIDIYNNSITGGDYVSSCFLINDGNGFFTEEW